MLSRYLILILTLIELGTGLTQQPDPFAGTFSNGQLTMNLTGQRGQYTGYFAIQGQQHPITAQLSGENIITGVFTYDGQQNAFQAQLQNDQLTVTDGSDIYLLTRQQERATVPDNAGMTKQVKHGDENKPAQMAPGEVGDKYLGFKFKPPQGWTAKQTQVGYLLGSQTQKGFILIIPHRYRSLPELQAAAMEGIVDENGTMLTLQGDTKPYGSNGISADFSGTVEWQKAKVRAIGLLSPHGGGITVLVGVATASYSEAYAQLTEQVAGSVQFFKPAIPPVNSEWRQTLNGARLTYLWSYYSGGSGGSYAGGSQKTIIDLCEQGYFTFSDNNQMAVDGGFGGGYNASGYGGGSDKGNGQWQVISRGQQAVLQLKFHDGRMQEYVLSYQDGKTYLDDRRFFRTYANDAVAEHRPQCW